MGNINSQTGQISTARFNTSLRSEASAKSDTEPWPRSYPKPGAHLQHKVLPEQGSRQNLRSTDNGEILQSGGTLSGRHQSPLRSPESRHYLPAQRYSFHKTGLRTSNPYQNRQNATNQRSFKSQVKSFKSEPDLRLQPPEKEMKERKSKKKYKAPAPPCRQPQGHRSGDWSESYNDDYVTRKTRLFKTRAETKKESSQLIVRSDQTESTPDVVEEKILAQEKNVGNLRPNRLSLPEFNIAESDEFQKELREATDRLRVTKTSREVEEGFQENENIFGIPEGPLSNRVHESEERCTRGEPSGKESSTPETSPVLGVPEPPKPRAFYFGMDHEDSEISSNCPIEDDDENPAIALRLRPVLPRKPPEVPRFSPAAAWRLLDSRSHDSGISDDARAPPPLSWTPQQDLGDDSSLEDTRRETPRHSRPRPHVFSLSLPRDNQLASFAAMGSSRNGVSSLRRLKRSVSGVLSTLSNKKEQEKKPPVSPEDSNWFFSRSAPNSLNENSSDIPEASFPHTSSTSRLMYLPNTTPRESPVEEKYPLSVFSKSCEELRVPESLRDPKSDLDFLWSTEDRSKKPKKFTFQSTVRQIERRRMAEKLSKEAEKKEKQRIKELEAMQRVEEEFQRKRAKEKANIRQQLRLYAMDDHQWTSLPPDITIKTEERQEPDGALSSSTSSSPQPPKSQDLMIRKNETSESKMTLHVTRELSEYRQAQRDYKEYRGHSKFTSDFRYFKPTTIHPEVTCNMPKAKGSNFGNGNYRKDFAYGMKSMSSNHSEDSQNNSTQMFHNKYSPITRF
ncbi:uncharacterized protein LOC115876800 [Sitophilus oryzae]|uniref:Uncharacterized protein LOC115876800 n=1 Tax=Sitophilus oryzae TaxID=7048 RepID=A0A6J2XBI3_SITOR|nr:uncharacterized protein LOC115876800 [Sitophilus oryzae]